MQPLFIIFGIFITLLAFILTGLNLSSEIENSTVYMLFWILYSVTFVTMINIVMTIYYYTIMKSKRGPPGKPGQMGEEGDFGKAGKCEASCRDDICINAIKEGVKKELKKLSGKEIDFNNIYLHHKIKQICGSSEFKRVSGYNGPNALVKYLEGIWKDWTRLLYNAGGDRYFEVIGGEESWDWVDNNPFDEMKKYDIFYWGMDKQFRPKEIDGCMENSQRESDLVKVCHTNNYTLITNTDGLNGSDFASFWRPKMVSYKGSNYYPVGDIVIGPKSDNDNIGAPRYVGKIKLNKKGLGPNRETILVGGDVRGPIKYELLWDSSDVGSNKNFYVWRPIGPRTNSGSYIALGDVITDSSSPPPTGAGSPIRCVNERHINKIIHNRNILWSSEGSGGVRYTNLLGFVPHNGTTTTVPGNSLNAYNLFRGVRGDINMIPDSDKNAQFYSIKSSSIDSSAIPGETALSSSKVASSIEDESGLGYQSSKKRDAKYSVQPFLQLKNEGYLYNRNSEKSFYIKSAGNNISNSYLIMIGNKAYDDFLSSRCLSAPSGNLITELCLPTNRKQYFKLDFTGYEKDQCRVKHKSSGKYLIVNSGNFELVSKIDKKGTRRDPSIFYFR